jgi:hypothetical protein
MSLIWRDELATVLIGIAAVLYLLWAGGTPVLGLSAPPGRWPTPSSGWESGGC